MLAIATDVIFIDNSSVHPDTIHSSSNQDRLHRSRARPTTGRIAVEVHYDTCTFRADLRKPLAAASSA